MKLRSKLLIFPLLIFIVAVCIGVVMNVCILSKSIREEARDQLVERSKKVESYLRRTLQTVEVLLDVFAHSFEAQSADYYGMCENMKIAIERNTGLLSKGFAGDITGMGVNTIGEEENFQKEESILISSFLFYLLIVKVCLNGIIVSVGHILVILQIQILKRMLNLLVERLMEC